MKFTISKTAVALGLAIATGNAQAVLTSSNTLTIENDAITTYTASGTAYVSSDGPMLDSFFTVNDPKKIMLDSQFAYLYNGAALTLTGVPQSDIATFTLYGKPGSYETLGTGISILSASGDTATVDMSGWVVDWDVQQDISLGVLGGWAGYSDPGVPYVSGVGNILCDAGSSCAVGSHYTLKYKATIPTLEFGAPYLPYYFELHGTVGAIPEASTYAMMLAGLAMVGAATRRRLQPGTSKQR
jgi:hypothetical protein